MAELSIPEFFEAEKMLDVGKVTGNEVIHAHHRIPFLDETVAQV